MISLILKTGISTCFQEFFLSIVRQSSTLSHNALILIYSNLSPMIINMKKIFAIMGALIAGGLAIVSSTVPAHAAAFN